MTMTIKNNGNNKKIITIIKIIVIMIIIIIINYSDNSDLLKQKRWDKYVMIERLN